MIKSMILLTALESAQFNRDKTIADKIVNFSCTFPPLASVFSFSGVLSTRYFGRWNHHVVERHGSQKGKTTAISGMRSVMPLISCSPRTLQMK